MAFITIIKNLRGPLSKSFSLSAEGRLLKTAAANLSVGTATRALVADLAALSCEIDALGPDQALVFGVCKPAFARVVAQEARAECRDKNAVCRDREHFDWPQGSGVLMLDIDKPKDASEAFSAQRFDALMRELLPWWRSVGRMYRPSASAFICDADGRELLGPGSLRCYAIVNKARDIPIVGVRIADAFWKAGYGRIEFSECGSRLIRCPVDTAVWQPERLDFAGPVVLGDGLTKKHFPPLILPGTDIDSDAALDGFMPLHVAPWSLKSQEVRAAFRAAKPEEVRRKSVVVEKRVQADVEKGEDVERSRRKWSSALIDGVLLGDYVLHFVDEDITVAQVLERAADFDGRRLADPEEPNYGNDPRIAIFYSNSGRPHIYSHAHGGKKYTLVRST